MTVIGAGQGESESVDTILDAQESGTVVITGDGVAATLHRLRIRKGKMDNGNPGGILHLGTQLRLRDCTVTDNSRPGGIGGVGGIAAGGTLEAERCTISHNRGFGAGSVGGVFSAETATLTDCLVELNEGGFGGGIGAGFIFTLAGKTIVQRNTAGAGGIDVATGATLNVGAKCRITRNKAVSGLGGGGIFNNSLAR